MKKVIIIGAGAAGLTAAYELLRNNYNVVILEARDRIGGRIHTIKDPGFSMPIEGGAEFIHGELPLTLQLLKDAKISMNEMQGDSYQVHGGKQHDGDFFNEDWTRMMAELHNLKEDVTFDKFLEEKFPYEKYKDLNDSLKSFVEGYNAADIDKASAFALRNEWTSEDDAIQFRPIGGYSQVTDYLYKCIKDLHGELYLTSIVREIQWHNEVKVLTTEGKSYQADLVLITVPIGVLQNQSIKFSPSLTDYHKAACNIGFGGVIKIVIEFRKGFWNDETQHKMPSLRFLFSDAAIPTWWSQLPNEAPVLTGWLGGPNSKIHKSKTEIFEMALGSLSYAFHCSKEFILSYVKAWHVSDWTRDLYSRGAYAYAMLHTNEAREILTTPVANILFFAGEALYEGPEIGTVEAAIASGKSVATKIKSIN